MIALWIHSAIDWPKSCLLGPCWASTVCMPLRGWRAVNQGNEGILEKTERPTSVWRLPSRLIIKRERSRVTTVTESIVQGTLVFSLMATTLDGFFQIPYLSFIGALFITQLGTLLFCLPLNTLITCLKTNNSPSRPLRLTRRVG